MMRKLLLIHGANLNLLGTRDTKQYGALTLKEIEDIVRHEAEKHGFYLATYQSNHEGNLIDKIQLEAMSCAGIIINPGAFAHYSYALHDALLDTKLPIVEVHLSDLIQRETWRQKSVTAVACIKTISGEKEHGYCRAVTILMEYLNRDDK